MPSRRAVLATLGVTLAAPTSGCSGGASNRLTPAVESRQRLGAASQILVTTNPTRKYTYLPEEDAVRYEERFNGVTHTERMPFEEWGTRRATEHARARLWSRFTARYQHFETVASGVGMVAAYELAPGDSGITPTEADFKRAINIAPKLYYYVRYAEQTGEIVQSPPIAWEEFVATVPRTVAVAIQFPEREYRAVLPGVCVRDVEPARTPKRVSASQ